MDNDKRIVTVGLTGAWDMHCQAPGIEWGDHQTVESYTKIPAGKALNINKALDYLRRMSVLTGLWGLADYAQLCDDLQLYELIDNRLTTVPGTTRTNITLEDTLNQRHMHLRFTEELCSTESLSKVAEELTQIVQHEDVCVVAGSLPSEDLFDSVMEVIKTCSDKGARLVLDSNGPGYAKLIQEGDISVISPNVSELSELLQQEVEDDPAAILKACQPLLQQVDIVLISRGKQGAMLVSNEQSLTCTLASPPRPVASEVGCGDHFLAGFLSVFSRNHSPLDKALAAGVQLATFHAWGLTDTLTADEINKMVDVKVAPLS